MSIIQFKTAIFNSGSYTPSATFATATTAGNTLLCFAGGETTYADVGIVTSMPSGWTKVEGPVQEANNKTAAVLWAYKNNPGGITTVTCSAGGGNDTVGLFCIAEITDDISSYTPDATGSNTGTANPQSVSITPVTNGDIVLLGICTHGASGTYTTPAGWTEIDSQAGTGYPGGFGFYYQVQATAANLNPTVTFSSTSDSWVAVAVALLPVAPKSGTFIPNLASIPIIPSV